MAVVVDTNHANSGKDYLEQISIAKDVMQSIDRHGDLKRLVKGLMIESYLEDGAQKADEHVFGKSITDPCLGWEKTEKLIHCHTSDTCYSQVIPSHALPASQARQQSSRLSDLQALSDPPA